MTNKNVKWWGLGALAIAILFMARRGIFSLASKLLIQFEGFSAVPYWDVSRWTWGYGTAAPAPPAMISKEQATAELEAVNRQNYAYLKPMITRNLNPSQWAALLSFAYNVGPGNADNLVPNINSGDDTALGVQWNKYVYAGGQVNSTLVQRRAKEFQIWMGNIAIM